MYLFPPHALTQFKQTVAHRAAVLGCDVSVSVLVHFNVDFNAKDKDGRSAVDLARLLSNKQCYEIATKKKNPLPKPESPFLGRSKYRVQIPILSSTPPYHKNIQFSVCVY